MPVKSLGHLTQVWVMAFLISSIVYLTTMAPGLLWGDSADAQLRVFTGDLSDARDLARAHVSYYLTARGLRAVTGLNAALAGNMVAAVAGAITVANMALVMALLVHRRTALIAGTLLLLLSHTLWQMSCGAEVVTYSTMCLSGELALVMSFLRYRRDSFLVGAAFLNGFGWTTHNLALLTWPAYLILFWRLRKKSNRASTKLIPVAGSAWLIGAAPLLMLAASAFVQSESFIDTIRSLFVGIYGGQVFNHDLSIGMVLRVASYLVLNFPSPLLLLAPWGWWSLRRTAPPGAWSYLTIIAVIFVLFGGRYNVPDQYTFMVHAYLLVVVFVAVGTDRLLNAKPYKPLTVGVVICALAGPILYFVSPKIVRASDLLSKHVPARDLPYRDTLAWFLQPWRTQYDGAERYAREVLKGLPQDAVLFADTTTRRPMMYLQATESLREDIRLGRGAQQAIWGDVTVSMEAVDRLVAAGLLFATSDERSHIPDWMLERRLRLTSYELVYRVEFASSDGSDRMLEN